MAHVDVAISIIKNMEIRQSLVFDKSRLNSSRILVSWFSPNSWAYGFRYGGVRFTLDFENLIKNKNFYWVEAIQYSPAACRILITDQDRSNMLPVYDPTLRDGPWWHDTQTERHYVNGNYCLEFMIERNIEIEEISQIDFVQHHPDMCSINKENVAACKERGMVGGKIGALLLSRCAAQAVDLSEVARKFVDEDGKLRFEFENALEYVLLKVRRDADFSGTVSSTSDLAIPLARSVLNASANGSHDESVSLAELFQSEESLMTATSMVLSDMLESDDYLAAIQKVLDC